MAEDELLGIYDDNNRMFNENYGEDAGLDELGKHDKRKFRKIAEELEKEVIEKMNEKSIEQYIPHQIRGTDMEEFVKKKYEKDGPYERFSPRGLLSPGEVDIGPEQIDLGKQENWDCGTTWVYSVAAHMLPYFPEKLLKLMKKGGAGPNFPGFLEDEVSEKFKVDRDYSLTVRNSNENTPKLVDKINKGGDRAKGYILVHPERMPDIFNESLIKKGAEKGIEEDAFVRMTKDREHTEKYYPK